MLSTFDLFHKHLEYKDGNLFWKIPTARWVNPGDIVGQSVMPNGYLRIGFLRKRYYLHRIIFFMHHGYFPKNVDHINGDRRDCRIENLRDASVQRNNMNRSKSEGTSSQYKGVHWRKDRQKWQAYIKFNKKKASLGCFHDEKDAARAYNQKAIELFNTRNLYNN